MAEPEDDNLESVTVVSEGTLASVATVRSDVQEDSQENIEATSESFFQENTKKTQFDSVNLEDISASEYTDDDGDDEDDDDGIFKDDKQKRKRLKKKKPKHVVIEDDSSSDDEKTLVNENINPTCFDQNLVYNANGPLGGNKSLPICQSDLTWMLWMWYYVRAVSSGALKAAEFLGEKLASFFGITTPKYQYVIDEYYKMKELEREEEEKERKEQEFVAQRKVEELSKLEGGNQELVYNQVSSSLTASNAAMS